MEDIDSLSPLASGEALYARGSPRPPDYVLQKAEYLYRYKRLKSNIMAITLTPLFIFTIWTQRKAQPKL